MPIDLEDLAYQRRAVHSVLGVLDGQAASTFENSNLFGIQANVTDLSAEQIEANKRRVIAENGVTEDEAKLSPDSDLCIEMETGTGKTLVYLRTAYELFQKYGLTKFIILVPSIAIKEGVLKTFADFKKPLADRYGFTPACFEYDSGKLSRLKHFIDDTQPQIMVMTIQSITADDRIINQKGRDDSFLGLTFLEALGRCRPILIMDEPQEGMDTTAAAERLTTLNPLLKLRYSATHKVVKNLLYRLTPFDAYQQGMVKKIEVLSVADKNGEATLKIEFSEVQSPKAGNKSGRASGPIKAKLTLWRAQGDAFQWKPTNWLQVGDNLGDKSGNISYRDYTIERIWKSLHDQKYRLKFTNGIELVLKERAGDMAGLFRQQLHWLIRRHFQKKPVLAARGIKCLSLVFIDKVDNYIRDNGLIRVLFREEYARVFREVHGVDAPAAQIEDCQGYYFAKTGGDEYTDSENAMLKNKKIFDEILRDKDALLDISNPREFIFSHSALGVGWDNPNIFNIATLNESYSEIKKRQELGRGLRICRDQSGRRIYDADDVKEGEETNLLTIVPNETYETFAAQYQEQIREIYGSAAAGSRLRHTHKGRRKVTKIKRTALFESSAFREFWKRLALKTDYTVTFDEAKIIERSIDALNRIVIPRYEAEVVLTRIKGLSAEAISSEELGRETEKLTASFAPLDLVEEMSENTSLSYPTIFRILHGFDNHAAVVRNPAKFLAAACAAIRRIELDEMLRTLSYHPTGESLPLEEFEPMRETFLPVEPTPARGVYDGVPCDSSVERSFASAAERDDQVVCFLKLPAFYEIPTPIGMYRPDFGLVVQRRSLREGTSDDFYFVIETKSTNDLDDLRALTEAERLKIRCALKHFEALQIEARLHYRPYLAPVADYHAGFKDKLPTS